MKSLNVLSAAFLASSLSIGVVHVHSLTNSLDDDICNQMASEDKCDTQPNVMLEFCQKACDDLIKSKAYYKTFDINEDESDEFYELHSKNWTGTDVKFSGFDGYITSIVNIGMRCIPGEDEIFANKIKQFRKAVPYTVEILVFPFSLSETVQTKDDCKHTKEMISQRHKKVHIMDIVKINGPDTHQVFKFLKDKTELRQMKEDRTTFFFVNHVATTIDVLEGAGLITVKKHIKERLIGWEDDL